MTYTPLTWENEVPNGTPRYRIVGANEEVIDTGATIELVNEVVAGTPVNAENMNHIEGGIYNAQLTADSAWGGAFQAIAAAEAAAAVANEAISVVQNLFVAGSTFLNSYSGTLQYNAGFTDIPGLSVTMTLPVMSTVIAWTSGSARTSTAGQSFQTRLVIDGVTDGAIGIQYSVTYSPLSLVAHRISVPAGSRTIKVQAYGSDIPATFYLCNLIVLAFKEG